MDGQITTISSKRKHEDAQPIMVKRKRGRPPLYERAAAPPPNRVPTPPPAQPVVSSRPQAVSHTQGEPLNVLPEASLSKSARVQIPGENSTDGPPPLLIVENDYRIGNRVGMGGGTPSLHRVSRTQLNVVSWVAYLTSQVTAVVATTDAAALTCHDKSLHIFDIKTGEMMLPQYSFKERHHSFSSMRTA
nr:uncharacterized protein LOC113805884 [Penaeus vannamei]